jgi:2-hydroxychromene-2-carboxylate isomerase
MTTLDFWCELASPYTYLSACRIEALAARVHVSVAWRPFSLHPIFKAVGWQTSPFGPAPFRGQFDYAASYSRSFFSSMNFISNSVGVM